MAFDNFMDLSVEIPRKAVKFTGNVSLNDCLEKFIEAEKMINCGYKCEGCKKTVNVEKDLTLFRFPKLLVIHLKRFYHSSMRREKLNTTVNFPKDSLDMRKYAPHSSKLNNLILLQPTVVSNVQYTIYMEFHTTVAVFMVDTTYGKCVKINFVSDVLNMGDNRWYNCNDSVISRRSSPDTDSSSAYVLFYVMQE